MNMALIWIMTLGFKATWPRVYVPQTVRQEVSCTSHGSHALWYVACGLVFILIWLSLLAACSIKPPIKYLDQWDLCVSAWVLAMCLLLELVAVLFVFTIVVNLTRVPAKFSIRVQLSWVPAFMFAGTENVHSIWKFINDLMSTIRTARQAYWSRHDVTCRARNETYVEDFDSVRGLRIMCMLYSRSWNMLHNRLVMHLNLTCATHGYYMYMHV